MKELKRLAKKGLSVLRRVLHGKKPYVNVATDAVFIDSGSWTFFCEEHFQPLEKMQLICDNFDLVRSKDYAKIVAYIGVIDKKTLPRLSNLRWLQLASHGYNGFDNRSLYKNDAVVVSNLKNVFADPIADYCIAAYHYFFSYSLRRLSKKRVELFDVPVIPRTVVVTIVGIGNIGSAIARKCKETGWIVLGVKKHLEHYEKPDCLDEVASFSQVEGFLSRSDYVINVLPETDETRGIFNLAFFKKMKKTALFCNVGRGSAVVDEDIEKAVNEKIIAGAVLDASTRKKYKSSRIIVTGHTSSVSSQNAEVFDEFFSSQLSKFCAGETVENVIPLE